MVSPISALSPVDSNESGSIGLANLSDDGLSPQLQRQSRGSRKRRKQALFVSPRASSIAPSQDDIPEDTGRFDGINDERSSFGMRKLDAYVHKSIAGSPRGVAADGILGRQDREDPADDKVASSVPREATSRRNRRHGHRSSRRGVHKDSHNVVVNSSSGRRSQRKKRQGRHLPGPVRPVSPAASGRDKPAQETALPPHARSDGDEMVVVEQRRWHEGGTSAIGAGRKTGQRQPHSDLQQSSDRPTPSESRQVSSRHRSRSRRSSTHKREGASRETSGVPDSGVHLQADAGRRVRTKVGVSSKSRRRRDIDTKRRNDSVLDSPRHKNALSRGQSKQGHRSGDAACPSAPFSRRQKDVSDHKHGRTGNSPPRGMLGYDNDVQCTDDDRSIDSCAGQEAGQAASAFDREDRGSVASVEGKRVFSARGQESLVDVASHSDASHGSAEFQSVHDSDSDSGTSLGSANVEVRRTVRRARWSIMPGEAAPSAPLPSVPDSNGSEDHQLARPPEMGRSMSRRRAKPADREAPAAIAQVAASASYSESEQDEEGYGTEEEVEEERIEYVGSHDMSKKEKKWRKRFRKDHGRGKVSRCSILIQKRTTVVPEVGLDLGGHNTGETDRADVLRRDESHSFEANAAGVAPVPKEKLPTKSSLRKATPVSPVQEVGSSLRQRKSPLVKQGAAAQQPQQVDGVSASDITGPRSRQSSCHSIVIDEEEKPSQGSTGSSRAGTPDRQKDSRRRIRQSRGLALSDEDSDTARKRAHFRRSDALNEDSYDFAVIVRVAFDQAQVAALQQARRRADAIAAANKMVMQFGKQPMNYPSHIRATPSRRLASLPLSDRDDDSDEDDADGIPDMVKGSSAQARTNSLLGKPSLADGIRHSDSASLSDSDSISASSDDYDTSQPGHGSVVPVDQQPLSNKLEDSEPRVPKPNSRALRSVREAHGKKSVAFADTPEGVKSSKARRYDAGSDTEGGTKPGHGGRGSDRPGGSAAGRRRKPDEEEEEDLRNAHKCEEILSSLRAAGLKAKRVRSLSRRKWLIKIRAPEWRLEEEAERLRLRLRRRDGGWSRFRRSTRHAFLPTIIEDDAESWTTEGSINGKVETTKSPSAGAAAPRFSSLPAGRRRVTLTVVTRQSVGRGSSLFHSSDRQTLINNILRSSTAEGGAELGAHTPLGAYVVAMFPLHMYARLQELRNDWLCIWRPRQAIAELDRIGTSLIVADGPSLIDPLQLQAQQNEGSGDGILRQLGLVADAPPIDGEETAANNDVGGLCCGPVHEDDLRTAGISVPHAHRAGALSSTAASGQCKFCCCICQHPCRHTSPQTGSEEGQCGDSTSCWTDVLAWMLLVATCGLILICAGTVCLPRPCCFSRGDHASSKKAGARRDRRSLALGAGMARFSLASTSSSVRKSVMRGGPIRFSQGGAALAAELTEEEANMRRCCRSDACQKRIAVGCANALTCQLTQSYHVASCAPTGCKFSCGDNGGEPLLELRELDMDQTDAAGLPLHDHEPVDRACCTMFCPASCGSCLGFMCFRAFCGCTACCCKCQRSCSRFWGNVLTQPLDRIAAYFGETVAFYFAWLEYYTHWLIVPSVAGVLLFLYQTWKNQVDVIFVPLFSLFVAVWSMVFLECWKRRNNELAYKWGVLNHEQEEVTRPQFRGEWRHDPVTGEVMRWYPVWRRTCKVFASLACVATQMVCVVVAMLFVFTTRDAILERIETQACMDGLASYTEICEARLGANATGLHAAALDFDGLAASLGIGTSSNGNTGVSTDDHRSRRLFDEATWSASKPESRSWAPDLPGFAHARYLLGLRLDDPVVPTARLLQSNSSAGDAESSHTQPDDSPIVGQLEQFRLHSSDANWWVAMLLPPVVYGFLIPCLDFIFGRLAILLNDWENHRTHSDYRNHRIAKVFSFRFVNCFISLFYYAFAPHSTLLQLTVQLAVFLVVGQLWNTALEVVLPCLWRRYQECRFQAKVQRALDSGLTEGRRGRRLIRHAKSQAWAESRLSRYDTFNDYAEMLIQFGYVTFFSWAFPLAPLCALVNNLIEMRTDAYKLCYFTQRPIAHKASGIGVWYNVLHVMSVFAVLTNCAHLAVASRQFVVYFPTLTSAQRILVVFLCEHFVLFLRMILAYTVPEMPAEVARLLKRDRLNHAKMQASGGAVKLKE